MSSIYAERLLWTTNYLIKKDFAVPEGVAAQCVNKLTCVYAPKALLVFSPFSYNYQIAKPVGILPGNLYRRIIDNTNEESNDETDIGLPQYISDLRD